MTGASRDPGTSANFRYTTSTDMTSNPRPARRGDGSRLGCNDGSVAPSITRVSD